MNVFYRMPTGGARPSCRWAQVFACMLVSVCDAKRAVCRSLTGETKNTGKLMQVRDLQTKRIGSQTLASQRTHRVEDPLAREVCEAVIAIEPSAFELFKSIKNIFYPIGSPYSKRNEKINSSRLFLGCLAARPLRPVFRRQVLF